MKDSQNTLAPIPLSSSAIFLSIESWTSSTADHSQLFATIKSAFRVRSSFSRNLYYFIVPYLGDQTPTPTEQRFKTRFTLAFVPLSSPSTRNLNYRLRMFPDVGEFNLVVAGLATFAATVGYAYTRRLSTSTMTGRPIIETAPPALQADLNMQVDIDSDVKVEETEIMDLWHDSTTVPPVAATKTEPSPPATIIPAPARRISLKRKVPHDGFDEPKVEDRGYPYNLANIYPNKRSKTPTDSEASTPTTESHRAPSPGVESIIDHTFDAVVLSHKTASSASPVIDNAQTPATDPPTPPSPILSVTDTVIANQDEETKQITPTRVRSPTPGSPPALPSPSISPVEHPLPLPLDTHEKPKETENENISIPNALPPVPVSATSPSASISTPQIFTNTGFSKFVNIDPFAASKFSAPKSTFVQVSNTGGFAAFAGSASPFSTAAALNRPPSAASVFGSPSSSFIRLKPTSSNTSASTTNHALSRTSIFGSGLDSSRSVFGSSTSARNIFGQAKQADLSAAEQFLKDVLGSPKGAGSSSAKDAADPEDDTKDSEDKEENRFESQQEEYEDNGESGGIERTAQEAEVLERERAHGHALVGAAEMQKIDTLTGEENENAVKTNASTKLYIKRGDRPFSRAILGHVKLLSHNTTGEERILFRRPPQKISMNVRLQQALRVNFSPEESELRCIIKESISASESEDGIAKSEVVIYVLKPGRNSSQKDFTSFAEELVEHQQMKQAPQQLKARSA